MQSVKREQYFKYAEMAMLPIFFAAAFLLCGFIEYSNGDDAYFYKMAHSMGFFDYIKMRYVGWEGRVTSEAMTYIAFYFGKGFWQFVNAVMLTLLPCGLIRIAKKINGPLSFEQSFYLAAASYTGILFLGMGVIGYGAFWITGSTFYLWSIVPGIWAVMPFVDLVYRSERLSRKSLFYAIPCGFIAAMGQEQIAAVAIAFGVIAIGYHYLREKRICWLSVLEVIIMIVALVALFFSPGTGARSRLEIDTWMPQFDQLSVGNHLFITFQWVISSFANEGRMLFIIIWVTGAMLLWQNSVKKEGKITGLLKIQTALCGIFSLGALLPYGGITFLSDMGMGVSDITQCVEQVATPSSVSFWNWTAMLWWSAAFCFTILLVFTAFHSLREKITGVLLILASAASAAIMYFSPTMYASGPRVLLMTEILHWMLIILLFAKLKGKWRPLLLGIYVAAGMLNFISQVSYMMSFL